MSILGLVIVLGLILGRQLGRQATEPVATTHPGPPATSGPVAEPEILPPRRITRAPHPSPPSAPAGALPGERWVTFRDREAMARFLDRLDGRGIRVLRSLDGLLTLRLAVTDDSALTDLLEGDEEMGFIFPAQIPGQGPIQPGAVGFGNRVLEWLGIGHEARDWGQGVRVAVLDTGVGAADRFTQTVRQNDLVPLPDDPSQLNPHGTAVAALIGGQDGIAPPVQMDSYRVARDDGTSDTFLIAEAIVAAVDGGADVINLSLGSVHDSLVLQRAINYATEAGAVLVASTGNNGIDQLLYPAADPRVVGVGAVDARGEHLEFSNTGTTSITAPGLDVASTAADGSAVRVSGTSFSAPLVSGAIAAIMSERQLSATAAWDWLSQHSHEAGAPGTDPVYGTGVLHLGRALRADQPGIHDAAIAAHHLSLDPQGHPRVQVVVENRGTESVVNAPVTVRTPAGVQQLNVTTLPPGEIQVFEVPLGWVEAGAQIDSRIELDGPDFHPADNQRIDVLNLAE